MNDFSLKEIEALVQAVQKPVTPPAANATQPKAFMVVPEDWTIKYPEVPEFPARIRQKVVLHDAASFGSYVQQFAQDTAAIFCNDDTRCFTAILDFHGGRVAPIPGDAPCAVVSAEMADSPRWCEHVATYTALTTPEFDVWMGKNKRIFTQLEFAEFLEDNLIDVIDPLGADLLEITRTLEAKKDVSYSSAIRLNNGSCRINYDEVIKGTANTQAGQMDIPEVFTLQMQVVRGGSIFKFPVRFKYRLKERQMIAWYEIVRPHKLLEQALIETMALIQGKTGMAIRKGVPSLA